MKIGVRAAGIAFCTWALAVFGQSASDSVKMIDHYKAVYGTSVIYLSYRVLAAVGGAIDTKDFNNILSRYNFMNADMQAFFRSERFSDPAASVGILQVNLDSRELCSKRANDLGYRMECRSWTGDSVAALLMLVEVMKKSSDAAQRDIDLAIRPDQKLQKIRQYSGHAFVMPEVVEDAQTNLAKDLLRPGRMSEVKQSLPAAAYGDLQSWLGEASKIASTASVSSPRQGDAVLSLEGHVFVVPQSNDWTEFGKSANPQQKLRAILDATADADAQGASSADVRKLKTKLWSEALRRSEGGRSGGALYK